jgi:hypothetical protein
MRSSRVTLALASGILGLAIAGPAQANIIVPASDSGWYDDGDFHNPDNGNYIAGLCCFGEGDQHRDFFVFDLSGVATPIAAARLRLFNPEAGFGSPDASETYTVFDVTTSIASLTDGTATAFADLGSGVVYGSLVMTALDNGTLVEIVFNAAGVAAINGALGGLFAVGGAVTTIDANLDLDDEFVFGYTDIEDTRVLDLEPVPEPGTLLLLGSGLAALRLRKRRW